VKSSRPSSELAIPYVVRSSRPFSELAIPYVVKSSCPSSELAIPYVVKSSRPSSELAIPYEVKIYALKYLDYTYIKLLNWSLITNFVFLFWVTFWMLIDIMFARDMYQVYEINDDWLIYTFAYIIFYFNSCSPHRVHFAF